MTRTTTKAITDQVGDAAHPLRGALQDYDPLMDSIGDAPLVLLGEASHGTHEFYRERARISKRLIEEKGFNAVAVEADWPDAYRVNSYVRGNLELPDSVDALAALPESYESLFHESTLPRFLLNLHDNSPAVAGLRKPRLERAIGVVYRPETERVSHYFYTELPKQFDVMLHFGHHTSCRTARAHWGMGEWRFA